MKKIWYFITTIAIAILFTSCSSGNNTKEINPSNTEFTSGDIARYVELVNEPCELTFVETDGSLPSQTLRIKVKMEMIKDGIDNVEYRDISFTQLFSVALVKLTDAAGAEVIDLEIDDASRLKLKKLLTKPKGTTEEIFFEKKVYNHEASSEWYKRSSQVSPYLTGGISIENQETKPADSEPEKPAFAPENVKLPSALKGKVEVIEVSKFVSNYGFPTVSITFKLLKTVNTTPLCSEYGQMWIAGIGQTKNGSNVRELLPNYNEWRSDDSDGSQFKNFLESEPDETICMEFSGSKDNSSDVDADLEKVETFKLKITN